MIKLNLILAFLVLGFTWLSCVPSAPSSSLPLITSTDSVHCDTKRKLATAFEQNGCKFEYFQQIERIPDPYNMNKTYDKITCHWLKITLPDGSCRIVRDIPSHLDSCVFKDFNRDGMKDRFDYDSGNHFTIQLFSKERNDFRKVDGYFSGEQWDFDTLRNLKWQQNEEKHGTGYELYRIEDTIKKVYAGTWENYVFGDPKPEKPKRPKWFNDSIKSEKQQIEIYWRKNLDSIMKTHTPK